MVWMYGESRKLSLLVLDLIDLNNIGVDMVCVYNFILSRNKLNTKKKKKALIPKFWD